jgi:deoxyribodipyrimidine photo-lyase
MAEQPAIVWFRDDLRLGDNPALCAAVDSGRPILFLYIFDQASDGLRALGGAARWWLHGSLAALDAGLRRRGASLTILCGDAGTILDFLVASDGPAAVYWNRRYGAAEIEVDRAIKTSLGERGVACASFNGALLREPWEVASASGSPFRVFTPYWRAARAAGEPLAPLPAPKTLTAARPGAQTAKAAVALDDLALEPTRPDWARGFAARWTRGEDGARKRLATFLDAELKGYAEGRDRPDRPSTSRLSPHLRFGDISPRQIWSASTQYALAHGGGGRDLDKFHAELGWREFSYQLLFHNPDLARVNFQSRFDAFPWRDDEPALAVWRRGRTGYPLVDAGMRELWTTGWMHNRVRMVVGSFLVKHLLIDWRRGEDWFWDTLVDADPASNAASWQWIAGSGADAAPYFRVFNPTKQGETFDAKGDYVRQWVPELAAMPADCIHRPWEADAATLKAAGVTLGTDYPRPIVDHPAARARALAAFSSIKTDA